MGTAARQSLAAGREALFQVINQDTWTLQWTRDGAPVPLICMGAIFDSNIGRHGDPHGMANERIMKGLADWMKMHQAEIKGLDPKRPFLPQFDLLTDEQMRDAFRSMDPWSNSFVPDESSALIKLISFLLLVTLSILVIHGHQARRKKRLQVHADARGVD